MCPTGHYCLAGTERSDQHPCPMGTYNPGTGLGAESECTSCDAGSFCDTAGQVAVSGKVVL